MSGGKAKWVDPAGRRFGKLVVIRRLPYWECRAAGIPVGGNGKDCECECDCGKRVFVTHQRLRQSERLGGTMSCGCSHHRGRPAGITRVCYYCNERKPIDEFAYKRVCSECAKTHQRTRPSQTVDEHRVKNRDRLRARYAVMSAIVDEYKLRSGCSNPGCKSGDIEHASVLDFHHKDKDTKLFAPANLRNGKIPIASIVSEVRKCILLCANCHRLAHAGVLDVSGIPTCEVSEADFLTSCQGSTPFGNASVQA